MGLTNLKAHQKLELWRIQELGIGSARFSEEARVQAPEHRVGLIMGFAHRDNIGYSPLTPDLSPRR